MMIDVTSQLHGGGLDQAVSVIPPHHRHETLVFFGTEVEGGRGGWLTG